MKLKKVGNRDTALRVLETSKWKIYFSYETPVAIYIDDDDIVYCTDNFYSVTTSRHINEIKKDNSYTKTVSQEILEKMISCRFYNF